MTRLEHDLCCYLIYDTDVVALLTVLPVRNNQPRCFSTHVVIR